MVTRDTLYSCSVQHYVVEPTEILNGAMILQNAVSVLHSSAAQYFKHATDFYTRD
jgi:hypothetical protein